jgi:hypothetical protein
MLRDCLRLGSPSTLDRMKTLVRSLAGLAAVALALILVPASPASGETCTENCLNKQRSCDGSCNQTKDKCMIMCGGPLGSDACVKQCNDAHRQCSLQCLGEGKLCEARCKTGQ